MAAVLPASYGDAEIKERLDDLRKRKGANVAKTTMARWLLKVVYHVLKERRPFIAGYNGLVECRSRLLIDLASSR